VASTSNVATLTGAAVTKLTEARRRKRLRMIRGF
jgi:hypothetical protein